ncbi:LOW QUALITY PROTEIN: hypothetical protein YC2023_019591 [Brassica napus]
MENSSYYSRPSTLSCGVLMGSGALVLNCIEYIEGMLQQLSMRKEFGFGSFWRHEDSSDIVDLKETEINEDQHLDLDEPSSKANTFRYQCSSLTTSSSLVGCKVFPYLLFTNFLIFWASLLGTLTKTKQVTCNTRHWQHHERTTQSAANAPQSSSIDMNKTSRITEMIHRMTCIYHVGTETCLPACLGILDGKRKVLNSLTFLCDSAVIKKGSALRSHFLAKSKSPMSFVSDIYTFSSRLFIRYTTTSPTMKDTWRMNHPLDMPSHLNEAAWRS